MQSTIICSAGTYAPEGKYLWDSWFVKHEGIWHMFHLQADASLLPTERHHHSEIGHATSADLLFWEQQPVALQPGSAGEWDDLALWTGDVVKKDDTFYQFYTGRSTSNFWGQTIGLATSKDLIHWQKHDQNPLLKAEQHYCSVDDGIACNFNETPAWRDPNIQFDPVTKLYYMCICARTAHGGSKYNAAIGLATSVDLLHWSLQAPLLAPNNYEEMETPQLIIHNEQYYLFFSSRAYRYEPSWRQQTGDHNGLHCYTSNSLHGEYTPAHLTGHVYSTIDHIYAPKIIEHHKDNQYIAIGWVDGGYLEGHGTDEFIGRLSCPFILELTPEKISVVGYL